MTSRWRLIESGSEGPFHNMALDEAIADSVRSGRCPPTLRLYGWSGPALSIGCFQKTSEIDIKYLKRRGIPLVRRPTGGRGVLHGADELTYSFSSGVKQGLFTGGLLESYRKISAAFLGAFTGLGFSAETRTGRHAPRSPVCFQAASYGEIAVEGRKVIGSAQKRWQDGFLQQGSLPYRIDYEELKNIFGFKTESAAPPMAGLLELMPALRPALIRDAIQTSFEKIFGIAFTKSSPDAEEETRAGELLRLKYLTQQWNLKR